MERASYRVYTPRDLSSIPPSTLKSHPTRRGGLGWSGFLFLIAIGSMIGGSSYAALSVVKPDAHAQTAFGVRPEAPAPKPPETPITPQPKPADVTTTTTPIVDAKAEPKTAEKAKPAPKPISIASIPRRPLVPSPRVRPTASATPKEPQAPALPPNPFDVPE